MKRRGVEWDWDLTLKPISLTTSYPKKKKKHAIMEELDNKQIKQANIKEINYKIVYQ